MIDSQCRSRPVRSLFWVWWTGWGRTAVFREPGRSLHRVLSRSVGLSLLRLAELIAEILPHELHLELGSPHVACDFFPRQMSLRACLCSPVVTGRTKSDQVGKLLFDVVHYVVYFCLLPCEVFSSLDSDGSSSHSQRVDRRKDESHLFQNKRFFLSLWILPSRKFVCLVGWVNINHMNFNVPKKNPISFGADPGKYILIIDYYITFSLDNRFCIE